MMSGWTMHTSTNRGYTYPDFSKDSLKFDKSFMLSGWTGAYFGISAKNNNSGL